MQHLHPLEHGRDQVQWPNKSKEIMSEKLEKKKLGNEGIFGGFTGWRIEDPRQRPHDKHALLLMETTATRRPRWPQNYFGSVFCPPFVRIGCITFFS